MELYNILIVDDEEIIVDWLASTLEKNAEYPLNTYRAYSAVSATDIMKKVRIDLMITDIKMPTMSGIELTKQIHSLWPNSKTIFLTAYSDFLYAQQAVNLGVTNYILKTASDVEILNAVSDALTQIETESNNLFLINRMEYDLKTYRSQFCRHLFFQWLNNNLCQYIDYDLEKVLNMLGFDSIKQSNFALIIGTISTIHNSEDNHIQTLARPLQIQQITMHYLETYISHAFFEIIDQSLIGIIQLNFEEKSHKIFLGGALELAQYSCLKSTNCNISYLISPPCTAFEIPAQWFNAQNILPNLTDPDYIYFLGQHEGNCFPIEFSEFENSSFPKKNFFDTMKKHLENGEWDNFYKMLKDICKYLSLHVNWHNNIILQLYYSLILIFITYINENNLSTEISFHISTGTLFRPWLLNNWNAVENQLFQLADFLRDTCIDKKRLSADKIINKIHEYVLSHITEDISLIDLSEITQYSTTYLSKYYSKVTGTTIKQYIAEQKIKKIEQLMMDPTLTIGEISTIAGFNSRNYFNNFVKRITGMAPNKYRDTLLKNQE